MGNKITRRKFLHTMAATAAGTAGLSAASCISLSPVYIKPDKLTGANEKLLLTNCSIIDVRTGKILIENQILIHNGKIAKLLRKGDSEGITPDRTVDLEGTYLMPGLINAHCHITMPCSGGIGIKLIAALKRQVERNAEECIKHGVTTVRDMLSASDWLGELNDKIKSEKITGPRILWSYGLDVDNGYMHKMAFLKNKSVMNFINDPAAAKDAVKMAADSGAAFIKLFQQPVTLMLPEKPLPLMDTPLVRAICDEASGNRMGIAMHCVDIAGLNKGIEGNITSLEHMPCEALLSDDQIRRFLDIRAGIIPTFSVGISMGFRTRNDKTWGKDSLARIVKLRSELLPSMIREYLEPAIVESTIQQYMDCSNPEYFESWHLVPVVNAEFTAGKSDTQSQNTKALFDAGVLMGCGNDGGIPFVFPGAMGVEMFCFELAGYKPSDLLKMATVNNAKILGMEKEIGSIDEGMIADIAVFKNNPLETVRNTFNPEMVFQEGMLVFRREHKII